MAAQTFSRTLPTARRNAGVLGCLRTMMSSQRTDPILVNQNTHSATIIINRPKVLNALNMQMIRKINLLLREFENSKSFVIVKGSHDKSFTVGGDIASLLEAGLAESIQFFREVYTMLYFVSHYKIPSIALIDGLTMGGGVGLAVHGRYCVATERTALAMPETAVGLFPDVGSSFFLNRLEGKLGLYLGMTGNRLRGKDVARTGLATHFCESSRLPDLESKLFTSTNPQDVPKILNDFSSDVVEEDGSVSLLMNQVNNCFTASTVEKIFENLEEDGSEWALSTLRTLKTKCPLSLKLTLRQLHQGSNQPLAECLKMEFRMASRCLGNYNFLEGVRSLLVDKDKNPKWNPSSLEAVTDDYVAKFFARLPESEELRL